MFILNPSVKNVIKVLSNVWLCLLAVGPVILVLDLTTLTPPHQHNYSRP